MIARSLAGRNRVRIVHGSGHGDSKESTPQSIAKHRRSLRFGATLNEGGGGATVVEFKPSCPTIILLLGGYKSS